MPDYEGGLVQMASGLNHIHCMNFVHRDIKPANILIAICEGSPIFKISDFGLCKTTSRSGMFTVSGIKGTESYLAPEYMTVDLSKSNEQKVRCHNAIDIFSLGCVFYYFLTNGCHPFGSGRLVVTKILSGDYNLSSKCD
jgi:serine/threonine protein kinase